MIDNSLRASNYSTFRINEDVLQIVHPVDQQGRLQCTGSGGLPRLQFAVTPSDDSEFWYLSHSEITVPSQHSDHGMQYDAEIQLSHYIKRPWHQ